MIEHASFHLASTLILASLSALSGSRVDRSAYQCKIGILDVGTLVESGMCNADER